MTSERKWRNMSLAVGIGGVVFYGFGAFLEGHKSLATSLQDIGSALVIAAAIAFLIERRTHAAMQDTIDDAASRMLSATLLSRGAAALDIEGIFVRRGTADERQQCIHAVQSALDYAIERGSRIDLLCVAGPDYFRSDGAHYRSLCEHLRRPGNKTTVRVLLLDPDSSAGKERARLEIGHGTESDIRIAGKTLTWLAAETNGRASHKYHDSPRSNFVLITDETLFHEAYPTAPTPPPEGPIGGVVALLQYKKTSRAYVRWKGHFEYEWAQGRTLPAEAPPTGR
jgi:hypothetical protein